MTSSLVRESIWLEDAVPQAEHKPSLKVTKE